MTKTEEKIRLLALEHCMKSGMRYMDSLAETLNQTFLLGLDTDEFQDALEFRENFRPEYQEYRRKMDAAGMK